MAKKIALSEKQTEIWNNIKDQKVEYYGLKNMTVANISEPLNLDPDLLYLSLKGPAALISIETVLSNDQVMGIEDTQVPRYVIEMKTKYAVIKSNPEAVK